MQKIDKTVLYVLLALIGTGYFLYLVSEILTPFIVAIVFSYFLAPIVSKFEKLKLPRILGVVIAVAILVLVVAILSFTIVPVLYKQILILIDRVSKHSHEIKLLSDSTLAQIKHIDPEFTARVEEVLRDFSGTMLNLSGQMLGRIFHSGLLAINVLAVIFITPVVTFYMLLGWDSLTKSFKSLLPKKYRATANKLGGEIHDTLAKYIRGQTTVCLVLGVFLASGLSILNVESGLALGFMSGMLWFIPYVGFIFSAVLCSTITALQFGDLHSVLMVLGLFMAAQVIESNFLTPKLIGESIGLNPVWIIFGLLSGGAIMGFVGVLIALPLTAVIGVIIKFSLSRYKESKFYN